MIRFAVPEELATLEVVGDGGRVRLTATGEHVVEAMPWLEAVR
jgi:hypothetical protein